MKTLLMVAILSISGNDQMVVSATIEKEMPSLKECEAFIHQEEFTANLQKSYPGSIGAFFNCVEIEIGLGV